MGQGAAPFKRSLGRTLINNPKQIMEEPYPSGMGLSYPSQTIPVINPEQNKVHDTTRGIRQGDIGVWGMNRMSMIGKLENSHMYIL